MIRLERCELEGLGREVMARKGLLAAKRALRGIVAVARMAVREDRRGVGDFVSLQRRAQNRCR